MTLRNNLATTAAAVRAAAENGADLIELGIPFSNPTAEGPVIQGANIRALKGGVTTDKIFDFVRELRKDVQIPMVFMTYANMVFSYDAEKFISTCKEIGISTPKQAKKMAGIVRSAIIKILEKYGTEAPKYVGEYVKEMKDAESVRGK